MTCNKAIIWGHKDSQNTYSYIQYGFFKAFKELGFETYWFEDKEENIDKAKNLGDAIYVTEGQVDKFIPIMKESFYVTHNCVPDKYDGLRKIGIQVITKSDPALLESIPMEPLTYYHKNGRTLYFPWATDLLPHEFDFDRVGKIPKEKRVYWVGTFSKDGPFENMSEITPFIDACKKREIEFIVKNGVSNEDNRALVNRSFMAPTIVGKWQKEVGFIPCRIFKNISYGELGITNSYHIKEIFKWLVLYEPDTSKMLEAVGNEMSDINRIKEGMRYVQKYHTYINRVKGILEVHGLS